MDEEELILLDEEVAAGAYDGLFREGCSFDFWWVVAVVLVGLVLGVLLGLLQ